MSIGSIEKEGWVGHPEIVGAVIHADRSEQQKYLSSQVVLEKSSIFCQYHLVVQFINENKYEAKENFHLINFPRKTKKKHIILCIPQRALFITNYCILLK